MLPVNNGDWVAEVIESSTTEFTAECRELNGSPPFGALVRVRSSPWWIYGVVHHISTQSIEPYRRPMAFGKTEEELRQEQPQIYALLRTHFQIIRAVEHLAHQRGIHDEALFEHHYRHLATLVQRSGYRFPNDRRQAEALALEVDAQLAKGDPECVACWRNLLRVAQRLGIPLSEGQLASFLLPHERRYFEAAMLARSSSPAPLALQCAAEDG